MKTVFLVLAIGSFASLAFSSEDNVNEFVDRIIANISEVYQNELFGLRFPKIMSFKSGCSNTRIDRLDSVQRNGDATIARASEDLISLDMALQLNNVHGNCNGWSKFHIAKVNRERLSIGYEGLVIKISSQLNTTARAFVVNEVLISDRWGVALRHGPILRLVIATFKTNIEKGIVGKLVDIVTQRMTGQDVDHLVARF